MRFSFPHPDSYDVDGADMASFLAQLVHVWNDFFFVGNGHVESAQICVFRNDFRKAFNRGNLKIDIFGVNPFVLEFFIEKVTRERMS